MNYRVIISQQAQDDIREITRWWATQRSSRQAESWYNKIYPAITALSMHPDRCPFAPELHPLPSGLRELHFGSGHRSTHRIIFTIIADEVRTFHVRHATQQYLTADDLPVQTP